MHRRPAPRPPDRGSARAAPVRTRLARKISLSRKVEIGWMRESSADALAIACRTGLEVLLAAPKPAQQADEMFFQRLLPDIGLRAFPAITRAMIIGVLALS